MATPEVLGISSEIYNELVNDVFAALKDGKVSLGETALLAGKMVNKLLPSVNLSLEKKKKLLLDILQKGLERVEKEVGSVLSDSDKSSVSEYFVSAAVSSLEAAAAVAYVGKSYFGFLVGLCWKGVPLPLEPSKVISKLEDVQTQVQNQVQNQVQQVQAQVQQVLPQVQPAIEETVGHQVTLTILEPPSVELAKQEDPLPNTVTEQSHQVEAPKNPRNDLD